MDITRYPGAPLLTVSKDWLLKTAPDAYQAFVAALRACVRDGECDASVGELQMSADGEYWNHEVLTPLLELEPAFEALRAAVKANFNPLADLGMGSYSGERTSRSDAVFFYWRDGYVRNKLYDGMVQDEAGAVSVDSDDEFCDFEADFYVLRMSELRKEN